MLKKWPEGGPSRLWETARIGEGYSTVAIVGNRIHTTGAIDDDCVITALDMEGKKVWTRTNGQAWDKSYPGTRSTPTITDDGLLYHETGIGNLVCLKADSGEVVWSVKNGCLTYADGMFYLYADNGNMALVKPTDTGFELTGKLKIEDPGERPTWAHPVVFGGRLYVRYGDKLGVYGVAEIESRQ